MLGRVTPARDHLHRGRCPLSSSSAFKITALPVRPPIHRPVGRREKEERDRDYQRKRDPIARALYRSKRWQTERAAFLHEHPLCMECQRNDVIRPASVVDHIDPHGGDELVFWDRSRWQALCASCHGKKTAGRDGGFGNARRCV